MYLISASARMALALSICSVVALGGGAALAQDPVPAKPGAAAGAATPAPAR